jgi:hypothetical protein
MGCNNSKNVDVQDQPTDRSQPNAKSSKFDDIEKGVKKVSNDPKELDKLWLEIDTSKDNKVNLTEVFRFVEKRYPALNDPNAINKAYTYTTQRDGNGDAFVDRNEFPFLLRNLVYFAKANQVFQKIAGGDGLINRADFRSGSSQLNLKLSETEENEEFKRMDKNGGGTVNFDEFVGWLAKRKCPIDGTVIQEYEASDPRKANATATANAAAKSAAASTAAKPAAAAALRPPSLLLRLPLRLPLRPPSLRLRLPLRPLLLLVARLRQSRPLPAPPSSRPTRVQSSTRSRMSSRRH